VKENPRTLVIETPEHFEIKLELAGIGSRSFAYIIDRLIQFGAVLAVFFLIMLLLVLFPKLILAGGLLDEIREKLALWFAAILLFAEGAIRIGYFMLFEYFWNGSTPGKKAVRIRAVRKDGQSLNFLDSMLRNIVRFVDIFGGVYPIGLIVMIIDRRYRRLGDLVAGTFVVVDNTTQKTLFVQPALDSQDIDPVIRKAASRMSPEDYALLTKFLSRRDDLEHGHRVQLAVKIYEKMLESTVDPNKPNVQVEKELAALEDAYRKTTRIL
jgi:uncharacterized RDD family membrane protein YckC